MTEFKSGRHIDALLGVVCRGQAVCGNVPCWVKIADVQAMKQVVSNGIRTVYTAHDSTSTLSLALCTVLGPLDATWPMTCTSAISPVLFMPKPDHEQPCQDACWDCTYASMPSCGTTAKLMTKQVAGAYLAVCWVVGLDEPCPTALHLLDVLYLLRHS